MIYVFILTKGIFSQLPDNEKEVIRLLYKIFKNIEVVSIILRFIDPDNYGIISPPAKYAIQQKLYTGWDYVNEYVEYLAVLREYKKLFGFERVADLENALWILVEKCLRGNNIPCNNLKKFREVFLAAEENLLIEKYKEKDYHERIYVLEDEIQHYKQKESELTDIYLADLSRLEKEKEQIKIDLDQSQNEIRRLEKFNRSFRPELFLI